MKNLSFRLLLSIVATTYSLMFLLTACSGNDEINSPQGDDLSSPMYAVIDYSDMESSIEDATLENDMMMSETMQNYSFMNAGSEFSQGHPYLLRAFWLKRYDFTKHLGRLLYSLQLTEEQKSSVSGFFRNYHDSMKEIALRFYQINKDVIKEANAGRKAIVEEYQSGLITRETALDRLKTLNAETRAKIFSNPANASIKDDICAVKTQLLGRIESVLSSDQLVKWNAAISRIKMPC